MNLVNENAEPRRMRAQGNGRFWRDDRGLAAVEFAMILPVMLFLYLGMVELSRGVRAARQVDNAAQTVADLIGQAQYATCPTDGSTPALANNNTPAIMCLAYLESVFTAAAAMIAPMPTSSLKVTVSEINIQQVSTTTSPYFYATVNWGYSIYQSSAPAARAGASSAACTALHPSSLTAANALTPSTVVTPIQSTVISASSVAAGSQPGPIILADISYTYTPIVQLGLGMFGNGAFGKLFTAGGFLMNRTVTGTVRNVFTTGGAPLYNHILFTSSASPTQNISTTMTLGSQTFNISGYNCLAPTTN